MPPNLHPNQRRRHIAIATPLGEAVLLLNRFSFRERLSAPFELETELSSVDHSIDYRKVVGFPVAIRLQMGPRGTRYFHGRVSRFVQTAGQGHYARYRATIVPWLWFLTRTSDCRVFQRESVVDIAEEVFNGHRFGSEFYDLRLRERYPKRRYCVQYRETDFNFVSRLLESEGIYYWFEHTRDRHRLVLADGLGASKPVPGFERLKYSAVQPEAAEGRTDITGWDIRQEVQPVSYRLKDFDFKKPSDPLEATHEIHRDHGMAHFRIYDYPGEYFEAKDAQRYARLRLEELQARHEVIQGVTAARGLGPGTVFELYDHPRADQNRKYLVTEVNLEANAGEFQTDGSGEEFFACHFTAIPADTPYRPARVTPKPVIQGIQTATVVGAKNKEVDPDDYGRVKVQFHWDTYGQRDEHSSCWVRVTQPWAGKGYGVMNIPRIGQEVVVEFIEGDPDRPLINGRLYHAENMPHASNAGRDGKKGNQKPRGLSGAGMMTSFKSSSLGGGGGYNEITMNDTGGQEGLFFKAQKDEIHNVGNDQENTIGNNRSTEVAVDSTEKIGNNRVEQVGNNATLTIGANRQEDVGVNDTLKVGTAKVIDVGATLLIKAGTSITLQCGASTIHMNQAGFITISGTIISVAAAVNASVVAPLTEIVGAAMLAEAGGLIKIFGGVTHVGAAGMTKVSGASVFSEAKGSNVTSGATVASVASGPNIVQGATVKVN